MEINITSAAFEGGGAIAPRYTCDGLNISPPLSWDSVPNGTRSLALIVDDPDAPGGSFVHWTIYDLPPDTRRLPEDVPKRRTLSSGAKQGINGAGGIGYTGPCPPSGTHRYFFKIYALDRRLDLGGGATAKRLSDAMEGHVLAEGQLMGTRRGRRSASHKDYPCRMSPQGTEHVLCPRSWITRSVQRPPVRVYLPR
ncbi:MAG: YbhB/YbcL family Raf kinase inhibitor-like protein, partial [Actinomycetota bacterium]|nr:YbhB/YbcL family Raf kinase inhibitor-like protein [Actinomycetota bacterium]